jgi:hypothetical protein
MIAKYFATSLAMGRSPRAARHKELLADFDDLDEFVGSLSRSTMLPASRAAMVPVFMRRRHRPAPAGASLVPSPHMATSLPCACSSRMSFSFVSGVAWARKSSTPASAAIAAAVRGCRR